MLRLDRGYFHTLKVAAIAIAVITMNFRTIIQQSMIVKEAVLAAATAFVVVRVAAHHEKMSYYVHPLVHVEQ